MNFEDAEVRAKAMIKKLGPTWVLNLNNAEGWNCSVKNGPCTVTFSVNSQQYQAMIKLGPTFTAYSNDPTIAMDMVVAKFDVYLQRLTADREKIGRIIAGTYPDKPF